MILGISIAIIVLLFLTGCASTYNFDYGSKLADFQEEKFKEYKDGTTIDEKDLERLEKNLWVKGANQFAIGNLTVKHLCLKDLVKGKDKNKRKIKKQLDTLGTNLWREGYSYWLYTKPFLTEYRDKFGMFNEYIKSIDLRFKQTAYKGKHGMLFPVPFGDISNISLEDQDEEGMLSDIELFPVDKKKISNSIIEYHITKCPIGLNAHIPVENSVVRIIDNDNVCLYENGECKEFPWYEGYDKKYKNLFEELKDVLRKERITSLLAKKWWKEYRKLNGEK